MKEIYPDKIIEKISNKKTGEVYKNEEEWKSKGISADDIRRDLTVVMPSLDLFGKTKFILPGKNKTLKSRLLYLSLTSAAIGRFSCCFNQTRQWSVWRGVLK